MVTNQLYIHVSRNNHFGIMHIEPILKTPTIRASPMGALQQVPSVGISWGLKAGLPSGVEGCRAGASMQSLPFSPGIACPLPLQRSRVAREAWAAWSLPLSKSFFLVGMGLDVGEVSIGDGVGWGVVKRCELRNESGPTVCKCCQESPSRQCRWLQLRR